MAPSASWAGSPHIKGSSESMRMALLTVGLIGLQFTWGIEMTYCTPYLLQLGLTKSKTSLVWIAGPLSGLIMQPVIGVLADNSRSKWGRRRPFMMCGATLVAILLLVLGWTAEIIGLFVSDEERAKPYVITLAVLTIYLVDFSINITQSTGRSLIVDTLPISKQQLGSAWATRMIAVGSIVTYVIGTLDLVKYVGFLGGTQFKILTVIASAIFFGTTAITCWAVEERILVSEREGDVKGNLVKMLAKILKTTLNLPDRIQAICWAQFWSWIGWFPFMFYSTTWVGEVYFRYHPEAEASADPLGDVGRIGSYSLVIFSIITFIGSVTLPWLVQPPESSNSNNNEKRPFTPRPHAVIGKYIEPLTPLITLLHDNKPTLLTVWQFGHLIFAGAMCLTPFVTSVHMATVLVSLCGISWALTCWAPYTFLGVEVNRLTAPSSSTGANGSTSYRRLSHSGSDDDEDLEASTVVVSAASSPKFLHIDHSSPFDEKDGFSLDHDREGVATTGETAGIYLGILNIFCTLPQFIGTFISWVVFSILEPGKSPELHKEGTKEDIQTAASRPNAIAVCLFIGACSAVVASYATGRMRRKGMR